MFNALRKCLKAAILCVAFAGSASAQDWMGYYAHPGNPHPEYPGTTSYWTQMGAAQASLYPAPVPVPAYAGQTFYTYEPLYPHHYLSAHKHVYVQPAISRCNRCRMPNSTTVHVSYRTTRVRSILDQMQLLLP